MSNSNCFLIDSNAVITPYAQYYPFEMVPKFWDEMKRRIEDGSICILDMVRDEILRGEDDLSQWFGKINIHTLIDHRLFLDKYGEVLNYIQNSGYYKHRALAEWAQSNIADPWLVAVACKCGYKIVTFETPVALNKSGLCGRPKIPNACIEFHTQYINLFEMMRELEFHL